MGGKLELGLTKNGTLDPREKEARIILSHIRAQGHPYIELRENGKKFIYFCVLCLAPCYSDSVVYDHLKEAQSNAQPIATDDTISDGSVLVIPRLKIATEAIDVHVRKVGLGMISARFAEKYGSLNGSEIRRIWCEWLGKEDSQEDDVEVQEHDFAVVVFPYSYDLGRDKVLEDTKPLRPSASMVELENGREISRKRKAPLSDPEDVSEFFRKHYASSAEESPPLRNAPSTSALDQSNSQLLRTKFVSNRATRKAMRRRERLAAEKVCNICQQNMIPGKDVATFFNLRTGRVACCSRNPTGAFHAASEKITGVQLPIQPLETLVCLYGSPSLEYPGLIKVAVHSGNPCDPDKRPWGSGVMMDEMKEWIEGRFCGLVDSTEPVMKQSCMYSMTPDEDFVIDFLGGEFGKNVVLGAGFSGHGFKMAPVIGKILTELAVDGQTNEVDLKHFRIGRFNASSKL
ncbi:hypothetical protein KIW84_057161 [Lathyrus oleraceus]|uniref:FAD dependent oxidoreductase domain-containing protein n=1 Tax=Pisum sativum TaxID=3888 RepID=A0A9D4X2V2_PEA|nr:hypothetical protein KIW84_057161 [Pisum sativum]